MIQQCFRVAALVASVAVAAVAVAQNSRTITIDPSGESTRVYLSHVDAAAEANFARMFEVPIYQNYKPYALILTNKSGKPIVAVTIRWIGTSAGKSGVFDSSCSSLLSGLGPGAGGTSTMLGRPASGQTRVQLGQSYISANGPVVAADGERMLVAPGLLAPESRGTGSGSSGIPAALESAETISAAIDAVVLEDGEVLGPDASHTVDSLLARKAAIDSVAGVVRAAELKGQDGIEALRQLANVPPGGGQPPEMRQQSQIARSLMMSRQWKEQLEKLAAFQLPPFHR